MAWTTSGVFFFHPFASTARLAHAAAFHILFQQLLAAAGDGVRIESEKTGQNRVSAAAEPERFQSRVQAALLFIEQAVKQNDRGFQFIRRDLQSGGVGDRGDGLDTAPQQALPLPGRRIGRGVEIQAGDEFTGDALASGELPQGILCFHVQCLR